MFSQFRVGYLHTPQLGEAVINKYYLDGWETQFVAPNGFPERIGNIWEHGYPWQAPFIAPSIHHWIDNQPLSLQNPFSLLGPSLWPTHHFHPTGWSSQSTEMSGDEHLQVFWHVQLLKENSSPMGSTSCQKNSKIPATRRGFSSNLSQKKHKQKSSLPLI